MIMTIDESMKLVIVFSEAKFEYNEDLDNNVFCLFLRTFLRKIMNYERTCYIESDVKFFNKSQMNHLRFVDKSYPGQLFWFS